MQQAMNSTSKKSWFTTGEIRRETKMHAKEQMPQLWKKVLVAQCNNIYKI